MSLTSSLAPRDSRLVASRGSLGDFANHWQLTLTDSDMRRMDREQLEMIEDGLWLIQQGLKRRTDGPLSTPRLSLPVRMTHGNEER